MKLFKKKYSLREALEIVKKDKKNKYTAVPIDPENEDTQYTIELIDKIQLKIREQAEQRKNRTHISERQEFNNRINGNGTYQNLEPVRQVQNYNNYQSAKRYNEYR